MAWASPVIVHKKKAAILLLLFISPLRHPNLHSNKSVVSPSIHNVEELTSVAVALLGHTFSLLNLTISYMENISQNGNKH